MAGTSVTHVGPVPITVPRLPWEKEAEAALNKAEGAVLGLLKENCQEKAENLAYAGGAAGGAGLILSGGGLASALVGGLLLKLGAYAGIGAGGVYFASKIEIC